MAYGRKSRKSGTRRAVTRRPVRRTSRRAPVRRSAARRSSAHHVVKIVIQHEPAASSNPGGMEMPQVQTQTKKAKF